MANTRSITVDVKVLIPEDTVYRCLRLLEMWMDDNPDKKILVDRVYTTTGYHHKMYVKGMEEPDDSKTMA